MKFRLFSLLLLFFATLNCGAYSVSLEHPAPVFEQPDMFSRIIGEAAEGSLIEAVSPVTGFSKRHPLSYYNEFHQLPDGGFVSPEIILTVNPESGRKEIMQLPPAPLLRLAACGALALLLAWFFLRYLDGRKKNLILPGSRQEACYLLAGIVLIRMLFLLANLIYEQNIITAAADETGYFQPALDMLQGNFSGPWSYTVGTGILYIPFILLCGAERFYDIAIPFSYFSGFIAAPGCLVLFFCILRQLGLSVRRAAIPVLIWALWPFFHFHIELWDRNIFQPFFCYLPQIDRPWHYYGVLINSGFNAMSDTPSLAAMLGCILLALRMPRRTMFLLLLGGLFGFSCLLRINNVLFLPLLGYLCCLRFRDRLTDWRFLSGSAAAAAGGFLLIFGIQLWINCHQFGNPLTFGYVLHAQELGGAPRPADGFTWRMFSTGQNIRYLAGVQHVLWTLGISGLLLLRNRRRRTLLTLWAVPVILFFFGYSHTFCDARRFLFVAFPAMLAALTMLECWRKLPLKHALILAGLIAGMVILVVPHPATPPMLAFQLQRFASGETLAGILRLFLPPGLCLYGGFLYRHHHRQAAFLAWLTTALFFFGHPYLMAALLALLLLRALTEWGIDFFRYVRIGKKS